MTLTHILPSLRRSIPDPLNRDHWPEFTTTSIADVTVAGVSLTALAGWCGTPCVHTTAAVIPNSDGLPSPTELTSVVVTRVVGAKTARDGSLDVWIDARLDAIDAQIPDARLIGRDSIAPDVHAVLHLADDHESGSNVVLEVGSDLHVGDLLAIPCRGVAVLADVDPARRRHAFASNAQGDQPSAHCGR